MIIFQNKHIHVIHTSSGVIQRRHSIISCTRTIKPWSMEDTYPYRSTPYFGSIARALCSKEKHLTPLVKLKSQYSILQFF